MSSLRHDPEVFLSLSYSSRTDSTGTVMLLSPTCNACVRKYQPLSPRMVVDHLCSSLSALDQIPSSFRRYEGIELLEKRYWKTCVLARHAAPLELLFSTCLVGIGPGPLTRTAPTEHMKAGCSYSHNAGPVHRLSVPRFIPSALHRSIIIPPNISLSLRPEHCVASITPNSTVNTTTSEVGFQNTPTPDKT